MGRPGGTRKQCAVGYGQEKPYCVEKFLRRGVSLKVKVDSVDILVLTRRWRFALILDDGSIYSYCFRLLFISSNN